MLEFILLKDKCTSIDSSTHQLSISESTTTLVDSTEHISSNYIPTNNHNSQNLNHHLNAYKDHSNIHLNNHQINYFNNYGNISEPILKTIENIKVLEPPSQLLKPPLPQNLDNYSKSRFMSPNHTTSAMNIKSL